MRPFHHSGFRSALALLVLASAVAACGVKGDLEAPPRASLDGPQSQSAAAATGDPTAVPEPPRQSVYRSESRVQSGRRLTAEPRIPPDEWTKKSEDESARTGSKGSGKSAPRPAREDNRSFVLDWLL